MMNQLSVTAKPVFTPIAIREQSDENYGSMARQLLSLAQKQFQSQSVSTGIATYKQVISTLNTIKQAIESDCQIIKNLEQQIEFLKQKPTSIVSQSSRATTITQHATPKPYSSGMSFFDHSSGGFLSSTVEDKDEDFDMTL